MDDGFDRICIEQFSDRLAVGNIKFCKMKIGPLLQDRQARLLKADVVVFIYIIDSNNFSTAIQKPRAHVISDKSGGSRYNDRHLAVTQIMGSIGACDTKTL